MIQTFPTREEWLAARRKSIGSSDAPVLYGLGYSSQSEFATWAEKVHGIATEWSAADLRRLKVGHAMESVLRDMMFDQHGFETGTDPPHSLRQHPTVAYATASIDCWDADDCIVELKNYGAHMAHEFRDGVPLRPTIQIQHQLWVTGTDYAWLYCMVGGEPIDEPIRVERDEAFIELHARKCAAFWRCVETKTPPDVDASEATKAALSSLYRRERGPRVEGDETVDRLTRTIERVDKAAERIKERGEEARNKLRSLIGDSEGIVSPNGAEWTWKTVERKAYEVAASSSRQLRRVGKRKGNR